MKVEAATKLSRIRAYLEGRHPPGFTVEAHVDVDTGALMFRVGSPSGIRGPLLVLSEEFVDDHWDEVERELDSRDVLGAMRKVGQGKVRVTKWELVLEPE